ncbi:MAG: hypothetical protein H6684_06000 [Deltaproteobacteria bacterium]|nr:hypothetical protein [Deltaproteobacteria bacterium]
MRKKIITGVVGAFVALVAVNLYFRTPAPTVPGLERPAIDPAVFDGGDGAVVTTSSKQRQSDLREQRLKEAQNAVKTVGEDNATKADNPRPVRRDTPRETAAEARKRRQEIRAKGVSGGMTPRPAKSNEESGNNRLTPERRKALEERAAELKEKIQKRRDAGIPPSIGSSVARRNAEERAEYLRERREARRADRMARGAAVSPSDLSAMEDLSDEELEEMAAEVGMDEDLDAILGEDHVDEGY